MTLAATSIVFRRGQRTVLDGVDLSVSKGEVVALLGTNGAGKSTLLRIMLGLITPASGTVTLDGRPLPDVARRVIARRVAYVPQTHAAHFPYTVDQVVAMGRVPQAGLGRRLSAVDREAIATSLARLQIGHLAHRVYTELSGGERQRVLLARALARDTSILVMDEPLTGLDFGQQMRLIELIRQLGADGYAILHTTHRPDEALQGATRAVLLHGGRIVADGPPRDVLDARSLANLYGIDVDQIDVGAHRYFRPLSSRNSDESTS